MNNARSIRFDLFERCREQILKRIGQTESAIDQLKATSSEETKSSAGDKYETGREMIGQELSKYLQSLQDAKNQLRQLQSVDLTFHSDGVRTGSVIRTDHGNFFIVASLNPVTFRDEIFLPVSAQSPVARKMFQMKAGDTFSLNGRNYKILFVD